MFFPGYIFDVDGKEWSSKKHFYDPLGEDKDEFIAYVNKLVELVRSGA